MPDDTGQVGHDRERLDEKARKAGTRHMILGFLALLVLLFLVSWCSLP